MLKLKPIYTAMFLAIIFFMVNIAFLMDFPTIHSDELWLKGIAEEMLRQGRFDVTEPFFDLYPRVVHPFRWLYNAVVMIGLNLLGNSVVIMRVIALIMGTSSVFVFYQILQKRFNNLLTSTFGTAILMLDIQMVYSSHMGRQETFILFLMLLGILMALNWPQKRHPLGFSVLIFLGLGVHPNSFLLGAVFSSIMITNIIFQKDKMLNWLKMVLMTSIGVLFHLIIGYIMNPTFISSYWSYGSALGVDAPLTNRFEGFYWYFYKLYHQIGGTYDLFSIKIPLMLLGLLICLWSVLFILKILRQKSYDENAFFPFASTLAMLVGLLIIGRYNQTAVLFLMPFIILMTLETVHLLASKSQKRMQAITPLMLILLIAIWGISLNNNLNDYRQQRFYSLDYQTMVDKIDAMIPDDAVVLGNLNTIEAHASDRFFDIRNLGYLDDTPGAFENYVSLRGITHIILHEEMDYINRTSPRWDFLYVQIDHYEQMENFIQNKTREIGSFENPLYAMRISRYSGTYPWKTTVYEVVQ